MQRQKKILLALAVLVIVVLGAGSYFVKIRTDEIKALHDTIITKKMLVQKKEANVQTIAEQLTHLDEEKEIFERSRKQLIPIEKIPQAIIHMSELIAEHHLNETNIKIDGIDKKNLEDSTLSDTLYTYTISLHCYGNEVDLLQFMKSINEDDYLYKITSVTWIPMKEKEMTELGLTLQVASINYIKKGQAD